MKQHDRDDFGKRMKEYEKVSQNKLMRRSPVIIRIDGKCFHNFTKNFVKPFDELLIKTMQQTMVYLCKNIQGCVLGYTQSDEISLLLIDYKNVNTAPWFDYEVQKMCSIVASMTTMIFNQKFNENVQDFGYDYCYNEGTSNYRDYIEGDKKEDYERFRRVYCKVLGTAMFDARTYNIPKDEVANYFYWRQNDAIRNSIQMVGQANFSHKALQNKSCSDIKSMLLKKGIDFNMIPIHKQRGSCSVKNMLMIQKNGRLSYGMMRNPYLKEKEWIIDMMIPVFKNDGRSYIDNILFEYDFGKAW